MSRVDYAHFQNWVDARYGDTYAWMIDRNQTLIKARSMSFEQAMAITSIDPDFPPTQQELDAQGIGAYGPPERLLESRSTRPAARYVAGLAFARWAQQAGDKFDAWMDATDGRQSFHSWAGHSRSMSIGIGIE